MGFQLEDGTGDSYQARINNQNMLAVITVSQAVKYFVNRQGHFYSIEVDTLVPDSTGSCFLYIKNTGDADIIVQRFSCCAVSNEVIDCYLDTIGSPVGGINYVPVNRNAGSANLVDAIVEYGTNITGLTTRSKLDHFHVAGDWNSHILRWEAGIMIPKNRTLTLHVEKGSIEICFTLTFFCCAGL
jgi:hypothetical protein